MFGKKFIEKKIEQAGQQAAGGGDPLGRASEMATKFGIHLDLADAVGAGPIEDQAEALRNGHVRGSLHIVSCTALDPRELRAPCHMNYVVQSPGIPAFAGEQVFEVWSKQWPSPGDDLPVIFDPRRPEKLKIQWGELPSHADSAELHAEQLAAQLNAGAVPPAQPTTVTPIVVGSADPEQIRQALLRAEQTLGIDLNGDGKIGTD